MAMNTPSNALKRAKTWWTSEKASPGRSIKEFRRRTFPLATENSTPIPELHENLTDDTASLPKKTTLSYKSDQVSILEFKQNSTPVSILRPLTSATTEPPLPTEPSPPVKPSPPPPALPTYDTPSTQLNARWRALRAASQTPGHVHNWLCPAWQPGDTVEPRPECPDKTFTLFSANLFTKEGSAHHEMLENRDLMNLARAKWKRALRLAEEDCG